MELLLNNTMAPITSEIGFLETNQRDVVQAFVDWQTPIQASRGVCLETRELEGTLEGILSFLLPLTSVERRRFLFVPTTSRWVAFFDNGYRGTDAMSTISYMAKILQCRGIRAVANPDTTKSEFKTLILEIYGPNKTTFLNYERSISLADDDGGLVFSETGTPFPFEETARYKERDKRKRFTFNMLSLYLKELGLTPFDKNFYLPYPNKATLLEKKGPTAAKLKDFSLLEARGE